MSKKKYALFIGRWQNWHKGHEWLIRQQFDQGKNVWLAIRDVEVDENNPKSGQEIYTELIKELFVMVGSGRLMISVIPDIESVNYGRGVGYEVIYHEPPQEVGDISGTKIRQGKINPDGTSKETHS
jgi:phosphopantetheine adenylyltransferase